MTPEEECQLRAELASAEERIDELEERLEHVPDSHTLREAQALIFDLRRNKDINLPTCSSILHRDAPSCDELVTCIIELATTVHRMDQDDYSQGFTRGQHDAQVLADEEHDEILADLQEAGLDLPAGSSIQDVADAVRTVVAERYAATEDLYGADGERIDLLRDLRGLGLPIEHDDGNDLVVSAVAHALRPSIAFRPHQPDPWEYDDDPTERVAIQADGPSIYYRLRHPEL